MYTTLVSAADSTGTSISTKLLVLIVVVLIAVPLLRKLRKAASENRKRRWVEQGLMDPPSARPESGERSK